MANLYQRKIQKNIFCISMLISSEEDGCKFILMYAVYIQFLDLIDFCCQNNYSYEDFIYCNDFEPKL